MRGVQSVAKQWQLSPLLSHYPEGHRLALIMPLRNLELGFSGLRTKTSLTHLSYTKSEALYDAESSVAFIASGAALDFFFK